MRWNLVMVLGLLGAVTLWASDDRLALVMGNAAYDGEAALANPKNDADDMAMSLTALGWQVTKLINGDRKQMTKAVSDFRNRLAASPGAQALVFYAGHGVQVGGQNYLIPVHETLDTEDDVENQALSLGLIQAAFDDAKVSTSIVLLDACRDNPFGHRSTRSMGGTRGLTVAQKTSGGGGSAVMFATAPGETAADGHGRNGLFTQAFLKYLPAGLSLQAMVTKVTAEVKTVSAGKQVPYSSLSLSDEYYLGAGHGAAPVDPMVVKASLVRERTAVVVQKTREQNAHPWGTILGWTGALAMVAGVVVAGLAYAHGDQVQRDYDARGTSATTDDYAAAQAALKSSSFWFQGAQLLAASGAGLDVAASLLGTDTSSYDERIRTLDQQITTLGAP